MTEVKQDLQEIKETLKNMQKSINEIGQTKLREIDEEMNELLKKKIRCSADEKVYIERRLNFLNKKYTDLFLTIHDPIDYEGIDEEIEISKEQ